MKFKEKPTGKPRAGSGTDVNSTPLKSCLKKRNASTAPSGSKRIKDKIKCVGFESFLDSSDKQFHDCLKRLQRCGKYDKNRLTRSSSDTKLVPINKEDWNDEDEIPLKRSGSLATVSKKQTGCAGRDTSSLQPCSFEQKKAALRALFSPLPAFPWEKKLNHIEEKLSSASLPSTSQTPTMLKTSISHHQHVVQNDFNAVTKSSMDIQDNQSEINTLSKTDNQSDSDDSLSDSDDSYSKNEDNRSEIRTELMECKTQVSLNRLQHIDSGIDLRKTSSTSSINMNISEYDSNPTSQQKLQSEPKVCCPSWLKINCDKCGKRDGMDVDLLEFLQSPLERTRIALKEKFQLTGQRAKPYSYRGRSKCQARKRWRLMPNIEGICPFKRRIRSSERPDELSNSKCLSNPCMHGWPAVSIKTKELACSADNKEHTTNSAPEINQEASVPLENTSEVVRKLKTLTAHEEFDHLSLKVTKSDPLAGGSDLEKTTTAPECFALSVFPSPENTSSSQIDITRVTLCIQHNVNEISKEGGEMEKCDKEHSMFDNCEEKLKRKRIIEVDEESVETQKRSRSNERSEDMDAQQRKRTNNTDIHEEGDKIQKSRKTNGVFEDSDEIRKLAMHFNDAVQCMYLSSKTDRSHRRPQSIHDEGNLNDTSLNVIEKGRSCEPDLLSDRAFSPVSSNSQTASSLPITTMCCAHLTANMTSPSKSSHNWFSRSHSSRSHSSRSHSLNSECCWPLSCRPLSPVPSPLRSKSMFQPASAPPLFQHGSEDEENYEDDCCVRSTKSNRAVNGGECFIRHNQYSSMLCVQFEESDVQSDTDISDDSSEEEDSEGSHTNYRNKRLTEQPNAMNTYLLNMSSDGKYLEVKDFMVNKYFADYMTELGIPQGSSNEPVISVAEEPVHTDSNDPRKVDALRDTNYSSDVIHRSFSVVPTASSETIQDHENDPNLANNERPTTSASSVIQNMQMETIISANLSLPPKLVPVVFQSDPTIESNQAMAEKPYTIAPMSIFANFYFPPNLRSAQRNIKETYKKGPNCKNKQFFPDPINPVPNVQQEEPDDINQVDLERFTEQLHIGPDCMSDDGSIPPSASGSPTFDISADAGSSQARPVMLSLDVNQLLSNIKGSYNVITMQYEAGHNNQASMTSLYMENHVETGVLENMSEVSTKGSSESLKDPKNSTSNLEVQKYFFDTLDVIQKARMTQSKNIQKVPNGNDYAVHAKTEGGIHNKNNKFRTNKALLEKIKLMAKSNSPVTPNSTMSCSSTGANQSEKIVSFLTDAINPALSAKFGSNQTSPSGFNVSRFRHATESAFVPIVNHEISNLSNQGICDNLIKSVPAVSPFNVSSQTSPAAVSPIPSVSQNAELITSGSTMGNVNTITPEDAECQSHQTILLNAVKLEHPTFIAPTISQNTMAAASKFSFPPNLANASSQNNAKIQSDQSQTINEITTAPVIYLNTDANTTPPILGTDMCNKSKKININSEPNLDNLQKPATSEAVSLTDQEMSNKCNPVILAHPTTSAPTVSEYVRNDATVKAGFSCMANLAILTHQKDDSGPTENKNPNISAIAEPEKTPRKSDGSQSSNVSFPTVGSTLTHITKNTKSVTYTTSDSDVSNKMQRQSVYTADFQIGLSTELTGAMGQTNHNVASGSNLANATIPLDHAAEVYQNTQNIECGFIPADIAAACSQKASDFAKGFSHDSISLTMDTSINSSTIAAPHNASMVKVSNPSTPALTALSPNTSSITNGFTAFTTPNFAIPSTYGSTNTVGCSEEKEISVHSASAPAKSWDIMMSCDTRCGKRRRFLDCEISRFPFYRKVKGYRARRRHRRARFRDRSPISRCPQHRGVPEEHSEVNRIKQQPFPLPFHPKPKSRN